MGKYNRQKFKVITIGTDVHVELKSLRAYAEESFSDVIRRLSKSFREINESFSIKKHVSSEAMQFYRSGLFVR